MDYNYIHAGQRYEENSASTSKITPIKKRKQILKSKSDIGVNSNKKSYFGRNIENISPNFNEEQKFDFFDVNEKIFDLKEKYLVTEEKLDDVSNKIERVEKKIIEYTKVSRIPKKLDMKGIEDREWRTISDPHIVTKKLMKELDKIQKAPQPKGCESFGKKQKDIPENLITILKDSVSVKGTEKHVNHDRAGEGELVFRKKFFCQEKIPYRMVCDGHGNKGEVASELVVKEFPKILAETLEEFNPKEWSKEGIWNALKIACVRMDGKFEEDIFGGTTMLFTVPLMGYSWSATVGDGSIFFINGDKTIPMNRAADLLNGDFARSIIKRGGEIFIKDSILCEEKLSNNLYVKEDFSGKTPRINKQLNIGRGFGNKVKVLKNSEGQKVYTARCKIARFNLDDLEKDHLVVQCTDGATAVASIDQMANVIREIRNSIMLDNNSFHPLAKEIVKFVMGAKEKRDDVTVQIFTLPQN